jgi:hypothetical protein
MLCTQLLRLSRNAAYNSGSHNGMAAAPAAAWSLTDCSVSGPGDLKPTTVMSATTPITNPTRIPPAEAIMWQQ